MSAKTCNVCQTIKPLDNYGKRASTKDGLSATCKDCLNARHRARRLIKRDQILAIERRYKAKVRDEPWLKQKTRERNQRLYYADVEASRAYYRDLRAKNKDSVAAANRKQRAKRKNAEVFAVSKKELNRIYASPCVFCGATENITLDHVIPLSRGGRHSVGNLQALCFSCNHRKHAKFMMEWRIAESRSPVELVRHI